MASDAADSSEPQTDSELARAVARGDRNAASALIQRHQSAVRSFLWRMTGRADLADDLAQDTFVRLLENAHRYKPQYAMRSWLLTIARRLCINRANRAVNQRSVTFEDVYSQTTQTPVDAVSRHEQSHLRRDAIDRALQQLTDEQRMAVVLFHSQQLSLQDTSDVMEMPINTVKSHLHRGRAKLRELLLPQREVIES